MTRDDILRMAREAGFPTIKHLSGRHDIAGQSVARFKRFAALVAAAERQRLHEKFMQIHESQKHSNNYWHFAARKIMEEK